LHFYPGLGYLCVNGVIGVYLIRGEKNLLGETATYSFAAGMKADGGMKPKQNVEALLRLPKMWITYLME
jgi:hypothetical protein